MEAFEITSERLADHTVVVKVNGEIDLLTAPQLENRLLDELRNGATRAVVDLSECTFIDSSAIHTLLKANALAQSRGNDQLTLMTDRPSIVKLLELTAVTTQFQIIPTRDVALTAA